MGEVVLRVPEDIAEAIRLPRDDLQHELKKELALALYRRGVLSSGKACTLSGLVRWEWEELLGKRKTARHYNEKDLQQDLAHARRCQ
jgi:predicted HTH domain antitoxin